MCLEEFSNKVKKALTDTYGEDAEVRCQSVRKNNGVILYGICVMKKENNVAPTIYLNDLFKRYEEGETFGSIMNEIIYLIDKHQISRSINIDFFTDYNQIKEKLVLRLIHFEKNRELLEEVPHRRFMDLAVVCHCIVESKEIGHGAILIRREHMESWEIDEDTMFDDAYYNTPKREPCQFINMEDMLKQSLMDAIANEAHRICEDEEEEQEMIRDMIGKMNTDLADRYIPMYILTNQKRYCGAVCILYPNILEIIGDILQEDYYVLPSSIHEFIIIRESEGADSTMINHVINEVNETQVDRMEWLSDHTYFYERDKKKLFALTNS